MISILAGSTLKALKKSFPNARNIVRSMPNIAGLINKAITCYTSINPLNEDEMLKV